MHSDFVEIYDVTSCHPPKIQHHRPVWKARTASPFLLDSRTIKNPIAAPCCPYTDQNETAHPPPKKKKRQQTSCKKRQNMPAHVKDRQHMSKPMHSESFGISRNLNIDKLGDALRASSIGTATPAGCSTRTRSYMHTLKNTQLHIPGLTTVILFQHLPALGTSTPNSPKYFLASLKDLNFLWST